MILSNGLAVCLSFTVLAGYLRKKLATDNIINSLALFGIFAGGFYFPSAVVAPVTIGWGWLVSSLFAIAFVERSTAVTVLACALALFSRETTLIFALTIFLALLVAEGDRSRGVVGSILVLATSCLLYLVLRVGFTLGYQHQIDPPHIIAQLTSLNFPCSFFYSIVPRAGHAGVASDFHRDQRAALRRLPCNFGGGRCRRGIGDRRHRCRIVAE